MFAPLPAWFRFRDLWPAPTRFQLGEHEKALRILVHELRDYAAAEQYCRVNSEGRDLADRRRLFHLLLAVYLDQNNKWGV